MNIHEAIKEIRISLGLSQTAFAKRLHVSFSTVSRWENGRVVPNRLASVAIISLAEECNLEKGLVDELKQLHSI